MTSNGCGEVSVDSVESTLFREKLCEEKPKVDAAIKSYCSWLLAQKQSSTTQQHQKQEAQQLDDDEEDAVATPMRTQHAWEMKVVLGLARKLSKSINAYVFDIRMDESMERSIVARVWNEIAAMSSNNTNSNKPSAASGVRITKMLGQTALLFAWKDLDRSDLLLPAAENEQQEQQEYESARLFLETFERFLFAKKNTAGEASAAASATDGSDLDDFPSSSSSTFNDAQLIWSPDGGKQELSRRATQRQKMALERLQQEEESQRLLLLQLQQQQHAMIGSGSDATAASTTPTITIIEEGDEKES
jgi:hypothetical protein